MPTPTPFPKLLVLGYGNTLRGDDGVGYLVAEAVAAWQCPGVRSLAVHQLLPEHAEAIAQAATVIFIDAVVAGDRTPLAIAFEPLVADRQASLRTHTVTPQLLLNLSQVLYGATPKAHLLAIPAVDFTLGNPLSAIALQGYDLALDYLKALLRNTLTCDIASHA